MRVTVPKPCSENWEQMQLASDASRFCASCQKCVVDFTHATDRDIIKHFEAADGNVCGRFTTSQLNRALVAPNATPRNYWNAFFSVALTSVVGMNNAAQAQTSQAENIRIYEGNQRFSSKGSQENKEKFNEESLFYKMKGVVTDANHQPISGASVIIKNTQTGDVTDDSGKFKIEIPKNLISKELILQVLFVGYQAQELNYKLNKIPENIKVIMVEENILGGDVVITGYGKPSLKGKINRFFKKIFSPNSHH